MPTNHDIYEFLRSTEEHMKQLRQRTSNSWQDDASLIAGAREAIASSQELLRDVAAS